MTDHYGVPPKTTSRSSTSPISTVIDEATITVVGVTKLVTSWPEQDSYGCTVKDLSLTFTGGGNTLPYRMSPAG